MDYGQEWGGYGGWGGSERVRGQCVVFNCARKVIVINSGAETVEECAGGIVEIRGSLLWVGRNGRVETSPGGMGRREGHSTS